MEVSWYFLGGWCGSFWIVWILCQEFGISKIVELKPEIQTLWIFKINWPLKKWKFWYISKIYSILKFKSFNKFIQISTIRKYNKSLKYLPHIHSLKGLLILNVCLLKCCRRKRNELRYKLMLLSLLLLLFKLICFLLFCIERVLRLNCMRTWVCR